MCLLILQKKKRRTHSPWCLSVLFASGKRGTKFAMISQLDRQTNRLQTNRVLPYT